MLSTHGLLLHFFNVIAMAGMRSTRTQATVRLRKHTFRANTALITPSNQIKCMATPRVLKEAYSHRRIKGSSTFSQ